MRFIGNKENLIGRIYEILKSKGITGKSFFDFFSGTTSVGKFFKKQGFAVYSSDLMYFSYILQKAYIENNESAKFSKLLQELNFQTQELFVNPLNIILSFLNNIKGQEGFIYNNYTPAGSMKLEIPRMYFSDANGKKIDAIRMQIENWKIADFITENEYYILIASLIESVPFYANITGVYSAFQKKWDIRALKNMQLREIELIESNKQHKVFNQNSVELLENIEADILYLDPPYNQRQYAPNYHILETIARYDNPEIKGVAGLRKYDNQKSVFCNAKTGLNELLKIVSEAKYNTFVLSYNTEGIMPKTEILNILNNFGDTELVEFDYLRFKSNNNGESKVKKMVQEQLYIIRK
jgi:adenine-specific DNA-methyltransferase